MDPMAVVRILWRHKLVALPFVLLTVALFLGALLFGPRAYQATSSFAMITPSLPTRVEIEESPALGAATDNPYLRSRDPTLVLQVGKTRLSSDEAVQSLQSAGLSTDFTVGQGLSTSAQILSITADAADPDTAVASVRRLGEILDEQIREVQLVNGASDRFLITVQPINEANEATERISSRLRNAAVAGIGGSMLLIAAVAIARGIDEGRRKRVDNADSPIGNRPIAEDSYAGSAHYAPETTLQTTSRRTSATADREKAMPTSVRSQSIQNPATTEIPAVPKPTPPARPEPTRRSSPVGQGQGVIPSRQASIRPAPPRPSPPGPVRRSTTVQPQPAHPTRIGSKSVPRHHNLET